MKTNKRTIDLVSRAIARARHNPARRRDPRRGLAMALLALAALATAGCDSQEKAPPPSDAAARLSGSAAAKPAPKPRSQRLEASKPAAGTSTQADPTATLMNPGDEVDGNVGADRVPGRARTKAQAAPAAPAAATGPTAADTSAARRMAAARGTRDRTDAAAAANPDDEKPTWSVLLASFTGEDHRANATSAREQIARRYPQLKDAFVRTTTRGSVILVGRFEGTKDPAAQAELKLVKEIQQDGQRVFGRAMLTRMGANPDLSPPGPHDLRTVRGDSPKGVLYTLQVAVWSALGTDEIKMSEIKRSAEAYCAQLRAQGEEAYYFHDYDTKTSVVTVGVFGADAYDSKSTLYAPEVEQAMRKHPKHLVNGEELLVPVDPSRPSGKAIPQAPRLVEVPKV